MEIPSTEPGFSTANTSAFEYPDQVLDFPVTSLTQFEDITLLQIPLPKAPGLSIDMRMFTVDDNYNVKPNTVSSDKVTVIFEE